MALRALVTFDAAHRVPTRTLFKRFNFSVQGSVNCGLTRTERLL